MKVAHFTYNITKIIIMVNKSGQTSKYPQKHRYQIHAKSSNCSESRSDDSKKKINRQFGTYFSKNEFFDFSRKRLKNTERGVHFDLIAIFYTKQ